MSENFDSQISNIENTSTATAPPAKKRGPKLVVLVALLIVLFSFISIPLFTPKYAPLLVTTDSVSEGMCSTITIDELCEQWNRLNPPDEFVDLWTLDSDSLQASIPQENGTIKAYYSCLFDNAGIAIIYESGTKRVTEIQMVYSTAYYQENTAKNNRSILIEKPCILASIISGIPADTLIEKYSNALANPNSIGLPVFYTKGLLGYLDAVSSEDILATKIFCCTKEFAQDYI